MKVFFDTNVFLYAFFDSLLLASAERDGCGVLYTEDLNDGQLYGAVRAVNPFK